LLVAAEVAAQLREVEVEVPADIELILDSL
jgi:hypothetical protein